MPQTFILIRIEEIFIFIYLQIPQILQRAGFYMPKEEANGANGAETEETKRQCLSTCRSVPSVTLSNSRFTQQQQQSTTYMPLQKYTGLSDKSYYFISNDVQLQNTPEGRAMNKVALATL